MKKLCLYIVFASGLSVCAQVPKAVRQEITYEDTQKLKEYNLRRIALEKKQKSGGLLTVPERVELSRLRATGVVQ